jgi:hypothetical protein
MGPTKKISTIALAGFIVVAPCALEFACVEAESQQFRSSRDCANLAKWFRAPFKESCDSLADRSFPPHNHSDNKDNDDAPPTVVLASGNSTNVAVVMTSFVWPPTDRS